MNVTGTDHATIRVPLGIFHEMKKGGAVGFTGRLWLNGFVLI
jgi:hypothetical protein